MQEERRYCADIYNESEQLQNYLTRVRKRNTC